MDVAAALQAAPTSVLQLLVDTAEACRTVLSRAAAAAEPQGLIQAYARLQQLQGRPVAVPVGAPASMADTAKVLGLIEGLMAAGAGGGAPAAAPSAAAAAAAQEPAASARGPHSSAKAAGGAGKGAPAAAAASRPEQVSCGFAGR
jgi:hypothetical protein